ncbi:Mitochondrial intermembrane space cysteine motif-containing protein MIX14 [Spathaspora sp. JA1]|nr:Mitochondrial intermembrane space cysteine motif-containing protein MIX14 [Spathaspora sp. JA1]
MVSEKGGLLDQILLEDIARNCPHEFLAFHQCMTLPEPDPEQCSQQQQQLAKCIRTAVPSFQKIQGECAGKLQVYETCLRINNSNTKACSSELQSLRNCAFGTLQ